MAERTRGRRAALLSGLVLALALGSLGVHQLNRNTGDRDHKPMAVLADRATPTLPGPAPAVTATTTRPAPVATQNAPADPDAPDPLLSVPISPRAALDRMRRCYAVNDAEQERFRQAQLRWLSPQAQVLERVAYAKAKAWAEPRCKDWSFAVHGERWKMLQETFIERARNSTDLGDRLAALAASSQRGDPAPTDMQPVRELLDAAMRSGDPNLLLEIGRSLASGHLGHIARLGIYGGGNHSSIAFALAGCDLGAACGADSELVLYACAMQGRCGYTDYPSLVYDAAVGRDDAVILRGVVDQIVQRIRSGQTAGMFDPPPKPIPLPGGG